TDSEGKFSTTFTPVPGEGGRYTVFACHPRITSLPAQCTFDLLGMRAENVTSSLNLIEGSFQYGSLTLRNLADVPLTGLTVEILKLPANLKVTSSFGEKFSGTLAGMGTASFTFLVEALDASVTSGTFTIRIKSNETTSYDIPVSFRVEALTPKLQADTLRVEAGMLRGKQSLVSFTVTNTGGLATGDIKVMLPQADWLSLAMQPTIPSLAPGESATVTLRLNPTATMELTSYSGNVLLQYEGGYLFVPFNFIAVSEAKGNLAITVTDEYTYFTDEAPNVANAKVRVTDAITGETAYTGVTNETGQIALNDLREGYYNIQVTADKHQTYNGTVFISGGQTKRVEAFLQGEYITYTWTVVPTEIADVTEVKLVTEYEVNVPAPVIIAEPQTPTGTIDLSDLKEVGQSKTIMVKITNYGFIAAEDVEIGFGTHPLYSIEPLITNFGTLDAKSSIYVPVVVTLIADLPEEQQAAPMMALSLSPEAEQAFAPYAAAAASVSYPCYIPGYVKGKYVCGSDGQEHWVSSGITVAGYYSNCGGGGGTGGGGGSIWGPVGPGGISSGKPVTVTATCQPCKPKTLVQVDFSKYFGFAEDALKNLIKKIPIVKTDDFDVDIDVHGDAVLCCNPDGSRGFGVDGEHGLLRPRSGHWHRGVQRLRL
ncbi:MAG: hypothetical protein FWC50_01390, partial [Planctomycetaceae bacterium]|nr:hypothetical protein [Planctomycetaceae bacterium]